MELPNDRPNVLAHPGRRLDVLTAPALRRHAASRLNRGPLVLDLSLVQEIDSSGMAALLALVKSARRNGADLTLRGVSPALSQLFEMTGLDRVVPSTPASPAASPSDAA